MILESISGSAVEVAGSNPATTGAGILVYQRKHLFIDYRKYSCVSSFVSCDPFLQNFYSKTLQERFFINFAASVGGDVLHSMQEQGL
jgi:hypothetical protein